MAGTARTLGFHLASALVLSMLLLGSAGGAAAHDPCRPTSFDAANCQVAGNGAYVTAAGGGFALGDARFRFVGTNAYYMYDATSYEAPGAAHRATEMMHVANDLGFTVLRTWGFMNADGSGNNNGTLAQRLLQPQPGIYKESEFVHLDYVLATANAHGVRLIFTFGNNWKEYGGIDQYLRWCKPGGTAVDFYRDPACVGVFKAYIAYVLGRTNTVNGRIYGEDPTIFAWELMNEPRCLGCPLDVVYDWIVEMARFIKHEAVIKRDPDGTPVLIGAPQMVATGEEGFDCTYYRDTKGVVHAYGYQDLGNIRLHPWMYDGSQGMCYGKNTRIADIDFGSFHIYPDAWRFKDGAQSETSWIRDHILIAKAGQQTPKGESLWADQWTSWGTALAKPAVLGEFGSSRADRATRFDAYLNAVGADETFDPAGKQGDGALVWQIMCPLCKNHATRLEVIFPPVSNESAVMCTYANRVNVAPVSCSPTQTYAPPENRR